MPVLDTSIVLTSLLWRTASWRYPFYAAPGDTLVITVVSDRELEAVYFGEFGEPPFLSEIYTDSITWIHVSDTVRPYTLEVRFRALLSKARVRVRILRKPAPGWENFNTTLKVVRVKVPYKDTLWDTTYVQIGRWEVFLPPKSDIFFAHTYGREPVFRLEGPTAGALIFLAPLKIDDSLRYKYGEFFLENPFHRDRVCKYFRYGHMDLAIVPYSEYENARAGYPFRAVEEFPGVEVGCFRVHMPAGEYAFILKNNAADAKNVVVRVLNLRLVPVVITRYRIIEKPSR
ncbi:MAG: hypothetical protein GXO29_01060 [Thermotogae bacterium]|nr:hypothetical protein [Thermotogota bacterium]